MEGRWMFEMFVRHVGSQRYEYISEKDIAPGELSS